MGSGSFQVSAQHPPVNASFDPDWLTFGATVF
jgi:hypothetical protein